MHSSHSIDRRLLIGFITFVLSLGAFSLFHAHGAAAEPPICTTDCPPPTITHKTITNTLTVNRPSAGTITSTPSGISCPAGSGGDCTVQDSQTVTCSDGDCAAPDPDGWQTYT